MAQTKETQNGTQEEVDCHVASGDSCHLVSHDVGLSGSCTINSKPKTLPLSHCFLKFRSLRTFHLSCRLACHCVLFGWVRAAIPTPPAETIVVSLAVFVGAKESKRGCGAKYRRRGRVRDFSGIYLLLLANKGLFALVVNSREKEERRRMGSSGMAAGMGGSSCCSGANDQGRGDGDGHIDTELWRACAGPLVTVPLVGEKVFYFPQGHMEQVEAHTNQEDNRQLPIYGLPYKILCRVVNVQLKAERDTDEVFVHATLLPEHKDEGVSRNKAVRTSIAKPCVRSFCKILTASDTSTHGGFSVPKRHADECLPPLDMTQQPPVQELVAKDLHGVEWSFRHIFRGQPKRHLLTTGWSTFVNAKKLVAGDAFIFLRSENGELRVGVRRAMRQHNSASASVISGQSMQLGLLASASHAITTGTMFSVYYWPRRSPEFVIPYNQYVESTKNNYSIGRKVRMKFEGEEDQEERITGTIISIEDTDPATWPGSEWRCFKVHWDDTSTIIRPQRVSPWNVTPFVAAAAQPPFVPRSKRRATHLPSPPDPSALIRDGPLKVSNEPAPRLCGVLQGQENLVPALGYIGDYLEQGTAHKILSSQRIPPSSPNAGRSNESINSHREMGLEDWTCSLRPQPCFHETYANGGISETSWLDSYWQRMLPTSIDLGASRAKPNRFQDMEVFKSRDTVENPTTEPIAMSSSLCKEHMSPNGFKEVEKSMYLETGEPSGVKPVSMIKIFGVELFENHVGPIMSHVAYSDGLPISYNALPATVPHMALSEPDMFSEPSKSTKPSECSVSDGFLAQSSTNQPVTARSCTKVHKLGTALGRSVDLSRFDGYESLIVELDHMFEFKGGLADRGSGWQVIYTDNEGDIMMIGDYPWPKFCSMVRKIYIYPKEEVKKLKPCLLNTNRHLEELAAGKKTACAYNVSG
ncbi:auxin response factor 7-like isoform X2 [Phoenix dactylifera]|uniref:Auxin response factor n=1 Tax=Phoenix dactylifera TaxID=42345 RepID=A0A8B7D5P1_PHODC|nr:auxin response factor 7-like isoform X2 [Phoenix dactylifera]